MTLTINVIMKKLHIYLMAAFAAFATIACQREELVQTPSPEENPEVQQGPAVWTLTAGFKAEDGGSQIAPASRTALEGTKVTWTVGDKINVNGVESLALTAADIEENAALAHFQFTEVPQGDSLVAIYPASAYNGTTVKDGETYQTFNVPATQSYDYQSAGYDAASAIMTGVGTGTSVAFVHAMLHAESSDSL